MQVVGDEEHREVEALLELFQKLEHLFLHRNVECRDRFVGDEQRGFERERAGDADALALAAREFMRKPVRRARIEADELEKPFRLFEGELAWNAGRDRTVRDARADAPARIERGERILEHHLDTAPAFPQLPPPQLREVRAADPNAARVGSEEPGDQAGDGRFSRTGFADEAERFSSADGEAHIAHRVDDALAGKSPVRLA